MYAPILYTLCFSLPGHHTQLGVPVLCYHDLQPKAINDMVNTPKNFEEHLKWLKDHGYKSLTLDQLAAGMKRKNSLPEKAVVITFDDGYEGVYKYGYPLLKKYGFNATLFLVTSKMGDRTPPMSHLTWTEVAEMDKSGVVQAEVHACKLHVKLGQKLKQEETEKKPTRDIAEDLRNAKVEIQRHTGRKVDYVAWPYGDYTKDLIALALKDGFVGMINTEYGINSPGGDIRRIKRIRMSSGYDTLSRFESKLSKFGVR